MPGEATENGVQPPKKKQREVSIFIFILVCLFSMASWLDMYGIWVEVPILVHILPEGWQLPSYLAVIMKAGNIAPITYLIINKLHKGNTKLREIACSYFIILIGATACLLLSVLWHKTASVGGSEHSVAFLVLVSVLSVVDCTSSVVFLPYMARFKPVYMTAFCIGGGLSGLFPAVLGLIQGAGLSSFCMNVTTAHNVTGSNITDSMLPRVLTNSTDNATDLLDATYTNDTVYYTHEMKYVYKEPKFNVEIYFLLLFFMLLLSGSAFTGLNFMPLSKKHKQKQQTHANETGEELRTIHQDSRPDSNGYIDDDYRDDGNHGDDNDGVSVIEGDRESLYYIDDLEYKPGCRDGCVAPSKSHFVYLICLNMWMCGIAYGVMPSLLSYSCLPYGDQTYGLTIKLITLVIPLAAMLTIFRTTSSVRIITLLTIVATVIGIYPIYLAVVSPNPPLQDQVAGQVLVILAGIVGAGIFSLAYTMNHILIHTMYGHRGLLWCGGSTQLGSFIGAVIIFILINVVEVFHSEDPCARF